MDHMLNLYVINGLLLGVLVSQCLIIHHVMGQMKRLKVSNIHIKWMRLFPWLSRLRPLYKVLVYYSDDLDKTYLSLEDKMVFHLLWTFIMPVLVFVSYIKGYLAIGSACTIFVGLFIVKKTILNSYKKKRAMIFSKNVYRLYMFLHNQFSAGVHPKDCVICLHKIVKDTFLKERLQAFSSLYVQTLDFELAFAEISDYYSGSDVDAFKIAIEQGLLIGENLEALKKQEALMFSKYMNYLQLETERQKLKTLLVVTMFSIIIIFMIGLPLTMELNQAMELIFI